jgi:tetratricopeptide (TPR) repeat protein
MNAVSEDELKKIRAEATAAMKAKKWSKAVSGWQRLRELKNDEAISYGQGSAALIQLGRLDEAEELVREALARFPKDSMLAVYWGAVAMAREDWPEALARWAAFRKRFKPTPHVCVQESIALVQVGKLDEAEALLIESERQWPQSKSIVFRLAELAVERQDWSTAITYWQEFRKRFGNSMIAYQQESEALLKLGRLEEAEVLLQEAAREYPIHMTIAKRLAQIAFQREDWSVASKRWSDVRARFGSSAEGYKQEVTALISLERRDEAECLLAEAVQCFPKSKGLAVRFADIAMTRRDWESAITRWTLVRQYFPEVSRAYDQGVLALLMQGQLNEAEELLQAAIQQFPQNSSLIARMEDLRAQRKERESLAQWKGFYADIADDVKSQRNLVKAKILEGETASELMESKIRSELMHPIKPPDRLWERLMSFFK